MQSLMNAINVLVMKSLKAARSIKNANIVQGSFIFLYYYYLKEYIVFVHEKIHNFSTKIREKSKEEFDRS